MHDFFFEIWELQKTNIFKDFDFPVTVKPISLRNTS